MAKPLNPALRDRLDQLAALATRKGRNLWDVLDEAGMLYTNERRTAERSDALLRAADDLDALSAPQILGASYQRGNFTAGDMRRGLMDQLYKITVQEQQGRR